MTTQELAERVKALRANWLEDAAARTAHFRDVGKFDEDPKRAIWSDIKAVYMTFQHNKCAYCETLLEGPPYGTIVHDVEHYRPKSSVKKWPTPRIAKQRSLSYQFRIGDAWNQGYYLLVYHLLNYATACKPCNTILKSNYFPIYGPNRVHSDTFADYRAEEPLLIYPLGDVDDDPEELISFEGIIAAPKKASGYGAYRARVTIDFFDLNGRDFLRQARAFHIKLLWDQLSIFQNDPDPAKRQEAREFVDILLSPISAHTNCTRAFYAVYQSDPQQAQAYYTEARNILIRR